METMICDDPNMETPERNLLLAIIIQAVEDLDSREFGSTQFFYDTDTRPVSFTWLCEQLDLDADAIRARIPILKKMMASKSREVAEARLRLMLCGRRR